MRKPPKALLVFLVIVGVAALGYYGRGYLKLLGPPEKCWEIKEMDGQLYKVNPCTGRFLLLGDVPGR